MNGRFPWWAWVLVFAPWVAGLAYALAIVITGDADRAFVLEMPATVAAIVGGTLASALVAAAVIGAQLVRTGDAPLGTAAPGLSERTSQLQQRFDTEIATRLTALRRRDAAESSAEIAELTSLVEDRLTLARLATDKIDPAPQDIGEILHDVAAMITNSPGLGGRHLAGPTVIVTVPVRSDRDLLVLVLRKIVLNAIDFSRPGDTITIRASDSDTTRDVVVEVSDTGTGVRSPEANLGLGLARAAAERLGGDVRVRSREGLGTVATLTLPRAAGTPRRVASR